MENERKVSYNEGCDLAHRLGTEYIETSSKARINVEEAFRKIIHRIKRTHLQGADGGQTHANRTNCVLQ